VSFDKVITKIIKVQFFLLHSVEEDHRNWWHESISTTLLCSNCTRTVDGIVNAIDRSPVASMTENHFTARFIARKCVSDRSHRLSASNVRTYRTVFTMHIGRYHDDVTDGKIYQWQRHAGTTILIAGCIGCRNAPSVTSVALFQQAAAADVISRLYPTSRSHVLS